MSEAESRPHGIELKASCTEAASARAGAVSLPRDGDRSGECETGCGEREDREEQRRRGRHPHHLTGPTAVPVQPPHRLAPTPASMTI